jgi:peroxiredoxin
LRLSEYRGDVVLLNFWTRSCGRCREQLEQLDRLHQEYGDSGFTVLSIAITDDPAHIAEIVSVLGFRFPILYDDHKVAARLYEPSSIPLTLLIDPHGDVRYVHKKYRRGDEVMYRDQLQTLLSE